MSKRNSIFEQFDPKAAKSKLNLGERFSEMDRQSQAQFARFWAAVAALVGVVSLIIFIKSVI